MTDTDGQLSLVLHAPSTDQPSSDSCDAEAGASSEVDDSAALAVRGDAESFRLLYRRYVRPVYRYLYAHTGNRTDAEDITAGVFEQTWANLKRYRPTGSFRGWLFTIARRALLRHYRAGRIQSRPVDDLVETLPDNGCGPEEHALQSERLGQVLQIVRTLPAEQQEVIYLRFLAELRYNEIAQVMQRSEASVKMIAYRTLKEIRKRYADVYASES